MHQVIDTSGLNVKSDEDLDETTCTHEILAFLARPDNERNMLFGIWQKLYIRFETGYYDEFDSDL
jgi:hypothetical protein